MGEVGNFLFGGSEQENNSNQNSSSNSSSSNNSSNQSTQGSVSVGRNGSSQTSQNGNQGYDMIASSMAPTLGMTAAGGNVLGAILGIPGYSMTKGPAAPAVSHASAPQAAPVAPPNTDDIVDLLGQLMEANKVTPAPAPTPPAGTPPATPPTGTPPVTPPATPPNTQAPPTYPPGSGGPVQNRPTPTPRFDMLGINTREEGGPVNAGEPYVVGEKRPEVFVPDQPGTIVPSEEMYQTMGAPQTAADVVAKAPHLKDPRIPHVRPQGLGLGRMHSGSGNETPRPGSSGSGFGNGLMDLLSGHIPGFDGSFSNMGGIEGPNYTYTGRGAGTNADPRDAFAAFRAGLPGRAGGGPVAPGQPYVVGENRPEVFVPGGGGRGPRGGGGLPSIPGIGSGGIGGIGGGIGIPGRGPRGGGGHGTGPITLPGPGNLPPGTPTTPTTPVTPTTPATPATPGGVTPQQAAMQNWADSAGFQFLLDNGTAAVSNLGSASGTFLSGATGKALEKFGTGLASTYQNDYINNILNFAKLGLGGASAISGAGGYGSSAGGSYGNSGSASYGQSSGSSSGSSSAGSNSSGSSSGEGNSKNGLVPAILG